MDASDWSYFSRRSGTAKLSVSRFGFIATGSGDLLTIFKEFPNEIKAYSCSKRFDYAISCLSFSHTSNRLFVGTDHGKGYILNVADLSVIATFETTSRRPSIAAIAANKVLSASVWSFHRPDELFIGFSNGDIVSARLDGPETVVNWTTNVGFSVDFLELDPHTQSSLIAACRSGSVVVLDGVYENEPTVCMKQEKEEYGAAGNCLLQCQFFERLESYFYAVTNEQLHFGAIRERRNMIMLPQGSFKKITGVWMPRVADDIVVVLTQSSMFVLECNDNVWATKQELPFGRATFVAQAPLSGEKLLVWLSSNDFLVFEFRRKNVVLKIISPFLPSKPVSFAVNKSLVAASTKDSRVYVMKNQKSALEIQQIFEFPMELKICQIEWISEHLLLVSGTETTRNKLFVVNTETRSVLSLLKPHHEFFGAEPSRISYGGGDRFAVSVGGILLLLYSVEDTPKLLRHVLFDTRFVVSFRNERQLNVVTKGQCEFRELDSLNKVGTLLLESVKGDIVHMVNLSTDLMIIGTTAGELYKVERQTVKNFASMRGGIRQLLCSPSKELILSVDENNNCLLINSSLVTKKIKQKVKRLVFLDANTILVNIWLSRTLCLLEPRDFMFLDTTPGFEIAGTEGSPDKFREMTAGITDIKRVYSIARDLGLYSVADVLSCFSDDFDSRCYGLNLSRKRFLEHVNFIIQFFKNDRGTKEIRLMKLLGRKEDVFNKLLSTTPDNPNFAKNAMKAAIASANLASVKQVKQMVKALVEGGCAQDAIDILILIERYFDAVKLLISEKDFETPVIILRTVLWEFETEDSIANMMNAVRSANSDYQVLSFLMAGHSYGDAYAELVKKGDLFAAAVVKGIEYDEDSEVVTFNHAAFVKHLSA